MFLRWMYGDLDILTILDICFDIGWIAWAVLDFSFGRWHGFFLDVAFLAFNMALRFFRKKRRG